MVLVKSVAGPFGQTTGPIIWLDEWTDHRILFGSVGRPQGGPSTTFSWSDEGMTKHTHLVKLVERPFGQTTGPIVSSNYRSYQSTDQLINLVEK